MPKSYDALPEGAIPIIDEQPKSYEQLPPGAIPVETKSAGKGGVPGAAGAAWTLHVQGTGERLPGESAEDHLARLKATDELAKKTVLNNLWMAASAPLWHNGLVTKTIGGGLGAIGGGIKNAIEEGPSLYKSGIAGYVASHLARPVVGPDYAPVVGAGVAAASKVPAFFRGAVPGARAGFQRIPIALPDQLAPINRTPVWINAPEGTVPVLQELEPIISRLPSGREPGKPKPSISRTPVWINTPEGASPMPKELEPILSKLPSGRSNEDPFLITIKRLSRQLDRAFKPGENFETLPSISPNEPREVMIRKLTEQLDKIFERP